MSSQKGGFIEIEPSFFTFQLGSRMQVIQVLADNH